MAQIKKKSIPDRLHCSYWWEIMLKNDGVNVKTKLTGYSKFQNEAENIDKLQCLIAKINMFEKNGYLERAEEIYIYKKLGVMPSANDRLILILKADRFIVPENLALKMPYYLKTFLDKFYFLRNGGESEKIKNLLPIPDKTRSKDDLFNVSKHFFKSIDQLHTWCTKQVANGENYNVVERFYKNYSQKYLQNGN
jgi:hypothetical protein